MTRVEPQPKHTQCVRCGKPRRRPKGKWCLPAWLTDGFYSTECAKAHHQAGRVAP